MSEPGTCVTDNIQHADAHPKFANCIGWEPVAPLPAKPIPPLLLQAYQIMRHLVGLSVADERSRADWIAAIEAEYHGVKEQA